MDKALEKGSNKSVEAFRTISEVAEDLALPQHVLRFWETRFPQIRPLKRAGGRRYYRPGDVDLLRTIRDLLHADGYTIKGVQRLMRERGARGLREVVGSAGAVPGSMVNAAEAIAALPPTSEGAAPPFAEALCGTADELETDLDGIRTMLATIEECEQLLRVALKPLDRC